MKLLFDQNISHHLVGKLKKVFPDSVHVRKVDLASASDKQIWEYAKRNSYAILSKDEDFHQMSFLFGHPPKVIWLKVGNSSTVQIEKILRRSVSKISTFLCDQEESFLILDL